MMKSEISSLNHHLNMVEGILRAMLSGETCLSQCQSVSAAQSSAEFFVALPSLLGLTEAQSKRAHSGTLNNLSRTLRKSGRVERVM